MWRTDVATSELKNFLIAIVVNLRIIESILVKDWGER